VADVKKLTDYYNDPWVRRRIREYCGESRSAPTCVYLSALEGDQATWDRASRVPVDALEHLLAGGADVARSMWDRSNMLIHLDLDYQNTDRKDEPYRHPSEMFAKLEPIYRATTGVLHRLGLPLLPIITGRGYHFTGRVPLDADVTSRLASIAPETPAWFFTLRDRCPAWIADQMSPVQARAYMGVGLIVEFLAHRILKRAHRRAPIPVVLNGTVVGAGHIGRECVSIDISYAGDPLDMRHLRVAYSSYQKHTSVLQASGPAVRVVPIAAVPRHRESQPALISGQRGLRHAVRSARRRPAAIPIVTPGMHRVLDAYEASYLAHFHRRFYETPPGPPEQFDALAASRQWRTLPDCVVSPLLQPNDRLLQPAVIQHVTRALMAESLAPRAIADIIHSRYAADFNWGDRWVSLDARTRAEFDVRVFAGLLAAGLDRGVDFNCRSAQEKELCPGTPCRYDLRTTRQRLLWSLVP
jgi:hypothetical protein